jgi:Protein kinase domain
MEQRGGSSEDQQVEGSETPRTTAVEAFEDRTMEQQKATGEPPPTAKRIVRKLSHHASNPPAVKRFKPIAVTESLDGDPHAIGEMTPAIVTEPATKLGAAIEQYGYVYGEEQQVANLDRKLPASVGGDRDETSAPMSPASDISSGSSPHHRSEVASAVDSGYIQEVPPAPPSTPASNRSSSGLFDHDHGLATPLPVREGVRNASQLERQQMLSEGGVTPAPNKSDASASSARALSLSEDFSEWAVGDRYEMIRILGRGSYGEVAQAVDKHAAHPDAYVAIKRISSPFDQEIDAIRLYREIHILRRLRGHNCIINLLDIVQPPTDDLDDFHDLYLVFECTLRRMSPPAANLCLTSCLLAPRNIRCGH